MGVSFENRKWGYLKWMVDKGQSYCNGCLRGIPLIETVVDLQFIEPFFETETQFSSSFFFFHFLCAQTQLFEAETYCICFGWQVKTPKDAASGYVKIAMAKIHHSSHRKTIGKCWFSGMFVDLHSGKLTYLWKD